MFHKSSIQGTKRKMEDSAFVSNPLSKLSKVTLLGSSILLLEIPAGTDTNFPVWESVRSQELDITWTVDPYSICVHLTPVTSKKGTAKRSSKPVKISSMAKQSAPSSSILQPHPVSQAIRQQPGAPQVNPYVCPPPPHNTLQSLPSLPAQPEVITPNPPKATTVLLSLPLVIHHSQPTTIKKVILPTTQTPTATAAKQQTLTKEPAPSFAFHTRNYSTKICDNFLLNICFAAKKCKMHHAPLPYQWQKRHVATQRWVNFPLHSQSLLEMFYCDVNEDIIVIKDGTTRNNLNFNSMEFEDKSEYCEIRRLTNSEQPSKNPYFPSEWMFYWRNGIFWEKHCKRVSKLLLKAMNEMKVECSFRLGSQEYRVDFNVMVQYNVSLGLYRDIRCRPVYRSLDSMRPYLKTGIQTEPSVPGFNHPTANFSVDPLEDFSSWFPPVWHLASEQDYSLVDVPAGTLAYKRVKNLFHESLSEAKAGIIHILQVQNRLQWDKYQRQKVHMKKQQSKSKNLLERHLFHGTTKKASEEICHHNFDPRISGVNGTDYGSGSYFATNASVSDRFASPIYPDDVCHMFLAKVLVGKMSIGCKEYRRPPPFWSKRSTYSLYDTCVDKKIQPTMYVVFDSCQCYPYYLIKYKKLPNEIEI